MQTVGWPFFAAHSSAEGRNDAKAMNNLYVDINIHTAGERSFFPAHFVLVYFQSSLLQLYRLVVHVANDDDDDDDKQ